LFLNSLTEYIKSKKPIILVRHGQSQSNVDPLVGGWQNPGLTSLGKEQAKAVALRLSNELKGKEFVVYSSHLRRAHETAIAICNELGVEPFIDEMLQEYQTHLDPGLSRPEAEQYKLVETTPAKNWRTFLGAESIGELYLRAGKVLSRISGQHDEIVVIVCHGWIIDKMIAWWMGIKKDEIRANMFTTANASISVLSVTQFGERALLKLNDTTHLMVFEEIDSYIN
jgi:broad specificity phosphatase PhoE